MVEGVGYPDQSFSHFESMDIWQTASTGRKGYEGWLGRYLNGTAAEQEDAFLALASDSRLPLALNTGKVAVPLVESLDAYQLQDDPRNAWNRLARTEALLEPLRVRAEGNALRRAVGQHRARGSAQLGRPAAGAQAVRACRRVRRVGSCPGASARRRGDRRRPGPARRDM